MLEFHLWLPDDGQALIVEEEQSTGVLQVLMSSRMRWEGQAYNPRSESPRSPEESLYLGTRAAVEGSLTFGKARLTDRRAGR